MKLQERNRKIASQLKGKIHPPSWAEFVKTGNHKQRQPESKEWWYERAASILLKVKNRGPIGTNKLRTTYGGKKNRGMKPERFKLSAGNHIRKMLQQLEAAGLIKQTDINGHKGRTITKEGLKILKEDGNNKAPKQEVKAGKLGRRTRWAPFWTVPKIYSPGRRVHPGRHTEGKRSWRRTKTKA